MPMRVTHSKSSADAKAYYAFSDYYDSGPNQLKGAWFGKGAALLGLSGEVDKNHFDRLVDNQHPFEDSRLTQRQRADRRVGTDITLSAPKSVSLLWGVTQDDRILEAVQKAAHETFSDLEKDALTRVNHSRGVLTWEKTGNIVGASWLHTTARPVDGHPDCQLHVHGFVLNATHTGKRWTAIDLSAVVRDSGYYEAIFQSRLAEKMLELGYPVERSERDFEVAGVGRETIEKFSRRTGLIEKMAEEHGITSPESKGQLGAKTREKKNQLVPPDELPSVWRSRLNEEEADHFDRLSRGEAISDQPEMSAAAAVDFAKGHVFERASVVRERELLRQAMLHGIGQVSVEQVHNEVVRREWIREGQDEQALISTREVLTEEQALLTFARSGRGKLAPLAPQHAIARDWLSDEQQTAVHGILNSHDRLMIVSGKAGVGKTSLMKETIEAIENTGRNVTVLAPTAEAAHGVLREKEGFDAETLASFLMNEKAQASAAGGVVWVDEAGLLGTSDMAKLATIGQRIDARIVLSGDERQHKAVSRGTPLKLLESEAGIQPFTIHRIRRQEGDYREAVTLLSQGKVVEGFEKLDDLGFIKEIADDDLRNRQLAQDYADSLSPDKSSLVIAPSHVEREQVTAAIRQELKARGTIHGPEHEMTVLQSKRLTEAQRSDSLSFAPGDVVEFVTKGKGGYKAGDRLRVAEVHDGRVWAEGQSGKVAVPIESPKSFDVYRERVEHFAAGDRVRVTKNRRPSKDSSEKRLNNGSLFELTGFTKSGDLKLSNGQTIPASWGHIEHGVTVTSYASQGKTVHRVFLAQSSLSLPASSAEQAYVSASRGRGQLTVYTDDKQTLRSAIGRERIVKNASELRPTIVTQNRWSERATSIRRFAENFAHQQTEKLRQWLAHEHVEMAR
ncbi:conjugative relaxase [Bremerella cremea]|uniref:Conjugative relaxase n=1 Tax=Bremerella cremea TaxID=1031537 RepID=A0A368KX10_9BACT|nr:MobF family relaxase [Bremerella cremea]RCS54869.1 conjugative relaxase [Bremerella cremea]